MPPKADAILDVVIIGGGIAGVVSLQKSLQGGLTCRLLEREPTIGGLWAKLPAWQDLQLAKDDWTLNGIPIRGILQPDVVENIRAWVPKFALSPHISLNTVVQNVTWESTHWSIQSSQGITKAKHIIVASGLHNLPRLPAIERDQSTVTEFHSSTFRDPASLRGKSVTVLGGGASAFDLLELAIANQAREIHWVFRSTTWMVPSRQPKDAKPHIRTLAYRQMKLSSVEEVSAVLQSFIVPRYRHYGMEAIRPPGDLDLRKTQLVAGRPLLVQNFARVSRHAGTIRSLRGNIVDTGTETFPTDVLLLGTGYRLDLDYLGLPKLQNLATARALREKCGSLVLSLDYPNLYFVGATFLDTNGSTPLNCAMLATTIVAHIRGKTVIPRTVISDNVNHWDILKLMASFDRSTYPRWWRWKYRFLASWYLRFPQSVIRF